MPLFDPVQAGQASERLREIISGAEDLQTKLLLLRQLLESVYKKLSEDSHTSFNGLFARMQYVHSKLDPPQVLVAQVNQLRILCNKAAHDEGFRLEEADYYSGLSCLRELLRWLHPGLADSALDDLLAVHQAHPFPAFQAARKESFICVARSWKILRSEAEDSGIEISANLEDGTDCTLWLNNLEGEGRRWSLLGKVLWPYCTLNCLNLTPVKGREHCYQSNPLTMVVAEPDFLIDASALAECFTTRGSRPEYYVLNRLIKEAAQEKPTQGNMINAILDELVTAPEADYQKLFQKCLASSPISLVALGKTSALAMYETIRDVHFPLLKEFAATLQDETVQLEPSYINPSYGLQGRLDILHSRDGKMNIVELKSGSAPKFDTWPSHQMQVVAYNLIVRDCYPRSVLGTSSIFYSASAGNNLRHVVNTVQQEQNLLMCRNRVVGILHGLALDPAQFFSWVLENGQARDTGFMQPRVESIVNILKSLPRHEYEWFLEQVRLLVREIWFEKSGGLGRDSIYGHNSLWQESLAAKRAHYRVLDSLKLASVSFNMVRFELPEAELVTDFRSGDIVVLYRQNTPVSQQEILRGQITRIGGREVEILIRGGLRRLPELYQSELWALEHDILESSLFSPFSQIYGFLQAPSATRELFLGLREPGFEAVPGDSGETLDSTVQKMLAARDYYIVQGPPGTGKTSGLLTAYIKKAHEDTSRNILIVSFTNRAVDEICLNLRKHAIPFIRTGHSDEIADELMDNLIRDKRYDDMSALLKANRIWVATVNSCNAWLNDLLKIVRIDELVVDEASQILENSILGIISKAGKTILIGDQNQLPPISRLGGEGFEFRDEKLAGLCYGAYNQSLMERLNQVCTSRGWNSACTMLRSHYRMHEEIAALVQRYYRDELVTAQPRQTEPLLAAHSDLPDARLTWIECPPSQFAYYDPLQVQGVLRILEFWASAGIIEDLGRDVGIVAPFRAMIHAILKELSPEQQAITIDTVERFQGSERRNIIITLPLRSASSLRNMEALSGDGSVDRKLNVALSRARERVVVLGNAEFCRSSNHYNILMDKIGACGKVLNINDILARRNHE